MNHPAVTSSQLLDLLAEKHASDVFVPECKDGPSQFGPGLKVLDVWAMNRSWVNACMFGYEIKISRTDFVSDQKWRAYMKLCNKFSFVCPPGLIRRDELPDGVGLYWSTTNGSRLYTKRHPAFREAEFPESLIRYLLMSRVEIKRHMLDTEPTSKTERWGRWLEDVRRERDIGWEVARTIKRMAGERTERMEEENEELKEENRSLRKAREILATLGIDEPTQIYNLEGNIRESVRRFKTGLPADLRSSCTELARQLRLVVEQLDELEGSKIPRSD